MTAAQDAREPVAPLGDGAEERLVSRHRASGPASVRGRSRMRAQLTALAVVPSACAALLAVTAVAVLTRASGQSQLLHGRTLAAVSMLGGLTFLVVVSGFVWARQVAYSTRGATVEVIRVPAPAPVPAPVQVPAAVPAAPVPAQPAATSPAPSQPAATDPASPAQSADRGVFVHLSHRLQSLVHRQIQLLDALENDVEEPDLLKGLFGVDHIATRMRRHAENLAVLGGAVPRRQWTKPVSVMEILRSAVSETLDYARVQVIARSPGSLNGYAVADVIHLLAELVENATTFSPPETKVVLRTQAVAAGLVIEIDDRGLGLPQAEYDRLNALLQEPAEVNVQDLLEGARIGLYVVAQLARRHRIAIRLQTNITGGTQALVVLPKALLATEPREYDQQTRESSAVTPPPPAPPVPAQSRPSAPVLPAPPMRTPSAVSVPGPGAPHRPAATVAAAGGVNTATTDISDTLASPGPLYSDKGALPDLRRPPNAAPAPLPAAIPAPASRPAAQSPTTQLGPYEPLPPRGNLPLNIPHETKPDTGAPSPATGPAGDRRYVSYAPVALAGPAPRVAPEAPAAAGPSPISPPDPRSRPPLPRRRPQAHLATALAQGAADPVDRVGDGLSPTLMADFRRGLVLGATEPSPEAHPYEHAPTQEGER